MVSDSVCRMTSLVCITTAHSYPGEPSRDLSSMTVRGMSFGSKIQIVALPRTELPWNPWEQHVGSSDFVVNENCVTRIVASLATMATQPKRLKDNADVGMRRCTLCRPQCTCLLSVTVNIPENENHILFAVRCVSIVLYDAIAESWVRQTEHGKIYKRPQSQHVEIVQHTHQASSR